jgi:hypothetical protein
MHSSFYKTKHCVLAVSTAIETYSFRFDHFETKDKRMISISFMSTMSSEYR